MLVCLCLLCTLSLLYLLLQIMRIIWISLRILLWSYYAYYYLSSDRHSPSAVCSDRRLQPQQPAKWISYLPLVFPFCRPSKRSLSATACPWPNKEPTEAAASSAQMAAGSGRHKSLYLRVMKTSVKPFGKTWVMLKTPTANPKDVKGSRPTAWKVLLVFFFFKKKSVLEESKQHRQENKQTALIWQKGQPPPPMAAGKGIAPCLA